MEQQIITVEKKKSELNAKNKFEYEKLSRNFPCFVPCRYQEEEEEILFEYDCSHVKNIGLIKREEYIHQLQFLINFASLYECFQGYKISFHVDNVFYDENFMPCVKERDLYEEMFKESEENFLFFYKTYICSIMTTEFTIMQLQESGLEILENQDIKVKEYLEADSIEKIVDLLRIEKKRYGEYQKKHMIVVNKKINKIKNIILLIFPTIFLGITGLLIYYMVVLCPFQKAIIGANEAYVQKNYIECIDSLETVSVAKMDVETKFILAISYAKSENLEAEKIDVLISKLSVNSNERELEYWIYLGRLDMKKAENLALSLSDDKLLIYAYMKELNQLETSTDMDGEEKQKRIGELESAIKTLGEKYSTEELENEAE